MAIDIIVEVWNDVRKECLCFDKEFSLADIIRDLIFFVLEKNLNLRNDFVLNQSRLWYSGWICGD